LTLICAGVLGTMLAASPVAAEIQTYQVRRLLAMKTTCQIAEIQMRDAVAPSRQYHADCANSGFYPSGVDVHCADREDERTCVVLTEARSFEYLRMLQPERQ